MTQNNNHLPVMLEEVSNLLFEKISTEQNVTFFDGTLGGGGYTQDFLNLAEAKKINLKQVSGDLDQTAIDRVKTYIQIPKGQQLEFIKGNFAELINTFQNHSLDGIVLDLGYSGNQLAESDRGFSYLNPSEELDLRYDTSSGISASDKLLKLKNHNDLGKLIYEYSGEDLAIKIARKFSEIKKKDSWTVQNMVELVISAIPPTAMKKKNQILSRVWQALRIWVNSEFESLNTFLPLALEKLKPQGRLVIVSFHSLEDKIVTKFLRNQTKPTKEDIYGNKSYSFKLLTAKGQFPSEAEVQRNTRSRSAILRAIERL
jgi:16S rRNA (cytosine1402-N4)-methyltransferase